MFGTAGSEEGANNGCAFRVKASADGVGFHADADEVVGGEAIESLLARNAHVSILRFA